MRTLLPGWAWLTLGGCCLVAAEAAAPRSVLQRQGPVSLSTTAAVANGMVELRLSELLLLTVRLEGQAPVAVAEPLRIVPHPAWQSRPVAKSVVPGPDPERGGWQQTLVLEPLLPGAQDLQLEPLRWRQGQGPWQTVTWQPLAVKVSTEVGQPDVKELRDITAIEGLAEPASGWAGWWSGALALLGCSGLLAWAWWSGRRRRRQAPRAGAAWTLRRLDKLLARDLPAAGQGRRFHALLSKLVRGYLEKHWQLPARRRPTAETLPAAAAVLSATQQAPLAEILDRCARAQFAPQTPSPEECRQVAELARVFLAGEKGAGNLLGPAPSGLSQPKVPDPFPPG